MRTVSAGRYRPPILLEIVTVHVVDVSVTVVVHSGRTVQLGLVHPHVGRQVGMVVLHAHVQHGHDDLRPPGIEFLPRLEKVDVGSRLPRAPRGVVVVVPLFAYLRIVGRGRPVGKLVAHGRIKILRRQHGRVIRPLQSVDRLHVRHPRHGGELAAGPRHGDIVADADIVPQVQTEPPPPRGETPPFGKDPPDFGGPQPGRNGIDLRVARRHGTAGEGTHTQSPGILGESDPHPPLEIDRLGDGIGYRPGAGTLRRHFRRFFHAGRQHKSRQERKGQSVLHFSFVFRSIVSPSARFPLPGRIRLRLYGFLPLPGTGAMPRIARQQREPSRKAAVRPAVTTVYRFSTVPLYVLPLRRTATV